MMATGIPAEVGRLWRCPQRGGRGSAQQAHLPGPGCGLGAIGGA